MASFCAQRHTRTLGVNVSERGTPGIREKSTGLMQMHCFADKANVGKTLHLHFQHCIGNCASSLLWRAESLYLSEFNLGSGNRVQAAALCRGGSCSHPTLTILRICIFLRKPRRANIRKRKVRATHTDWETLPEDPEVAAVFLPHFAKGHEIINSVHKSWPPLHPSYGAGDMWMCCRAAGVLMNVIVDLKPSVPPLQKRTEWESDK